MIIISHRGNLDGPSKKRENKPSSIKECISLGFSVEVDFWYTKKSGFLLGHDFPQYKIDIIDYDQYKKFLWCHAKNLEALIELKKMNFNCFWHQDDSYTLTSHGFVWTYPNIRANKEVIVVDNELVNPEVLNKNVLGVCTDYPLKVKTALSSNGPSKL